MPSSALLIVLSSLYFLFCCNGCTGGNMPKTLRSLTFNLFFNSVLIFLLIGCAEADESGRIKVLDRMMYTINPNAVMVGPVFRDAGGKAERTKYASDVVTAIIKEADARARKYSEAGDTQAYYAFLIMSLAVPMHESFYLQFRNVDGDVCRSNANNGELVKSVSTTIYKLFVEYFKKPQDPFFPNCEDMKVRKGVKQIVRGGDGTDLSMMQISIRWHFDDFLANKKYQDVSKTLNYGLGLLLDGFNPVYRNIANYKCLLDVNSDGQQTKINYIKLIRGIWAGKYNSGSILHTCRFADPNSPYKSHDIVFAKNLDKILKFDGVISTDYIGNFNLDNNTSEAIKEIVKNLKENKNERRALNLLLK